MAVDCDCFLFEMVFYSKAPPHKEREEMKITYDREVDAAYIRLSDDEASGVIEMSEGVNLDMTEDGKIVGIEILDATRIFGS